MIFRAGGGANLLRGRAEADIVGFRPGVDSAVVPLVATPDFLEQDPALSPDGRWLAYTSNETGRNEVYVRPFPNVESTRVLVSTDGGSNPLWAHSQNELFFVDLSGTNLIAARVETDQEFRVLQRETLFTNSAAGGIAVAGADLYDITPDDQQFLMIGLATGAPGSSESGTRFILVQNFFEVLRERVGN